MSDCPRDGVPTCGPAADCPHLEYGPDPVRLTTIRLCTETGHPIDPGNYEGPVHCTAHPEGHACTTALYDRRPIEVHINAERDLTEDEWRLLGDLFHRAFEKSAHSATDGGDKCE